MKISGRFIVLLFLAAAALPVTADVFGGSSWLRATGEDWAPRQTGVRALAEAAENGDAKAMRQLGLMSMKGQKVKKSARIAVQWWEKAADAGDAVSMMYLGDASARGLGCSKNAPKAMKWYADAFSAMQEEDERLDCNPELPLVKRIRKLPLSVTLKWWKERCEAGDAHAMYYLGTLGKKKRDGELSEEDAASYLAQAAAAGHAKARKKLERQDARQAKSAEEETVDSQRDAETEDVPEADNEQDEDTLEPENGGKSAEISDSQRGAETADAPEVDDGLNEAGVETEPGCGEKDAPADGDVSSEDKAEQPDVSSDKTQTDSNEAEGSAENHSPTVATNGATGISAKIDAAYDRIRASQEATDQRQLRENAAWERVNHGVSKAGKAYDALRGALALRGKAEEKAQMGDTGGAKYYMRLAAESFEIAEENLERSKREGDTYDVEMYNQLLRELNPPSYGLPVFISIAIFAATGFGVFYYIRKKKARSEESADKNDEAIHQSPAEPFPPLPAHMQKGADMKQYYICQPGCPATGPFPGAMVREAVHHRLYTPDTLAKSDENPEWVSVYQLFQ